MYLPRCYQLLLIAFALFATGCKAGPISLVRGLQRASMARVPSDYQQRVAAIRELPLD
jgi:hypothetical protein